MAEKFGIGDLGLDKVGIGPLNVGNVLDTVEFVKKAWSSFGIPPSFAPTVDLAELDKRIADLKTVEQWLAVNMSMLQGTIRALEIQRGTIATLQAVGGAVGAPVAAAMPAAAALAAALGQMPGAAAAADGAAPSGPGTATAAPEVAAPRAGKPKRTHRGRPAAGASAPSGFVDPGLSPGAWWNLLQDQFNQVASAALSGVGVPRPGATGAARPGTGPGAPPAGPAAGRGKAGTKSGGKSRRAAGRRTGGGTRKD